MSKIRQPVGPQNHKESTHNEAPRYLNWIERQPRIHFFTWNDFCAASSHPLPPHYFMTMIPNGIHTLVWPLITKLVLKECDSVTGINHLAFEFDTLGKSHSRQMWCVQCLYLALMIRFSHACVALETNNPTSTKGQCATRPLGPLHRILRHRPI